MNSVVKLVNLWAEFEQNNAQADIDEFCRQYLAKRRQENLAGPVAGGVVPQTNSALLLKLIGRINKINMSYGASALKGTGLNQVEEMSMLLTIRQEQNPRKSDVIYSNLFELTSGTDMLNRLVNRELVKENDDQEDRRSKRMELTPAGEKTLNAARKQMAKVAQLVLNELTEEEIKTCIQLLVNIDIKYSKVWQRHKAMPFEQSYDEMLPINKAEQQ